MEDRLRRGQLRVPRRRRAEARQTAPSCTPGPIPVKTFWAIDIHDTQTRSLLQTGNPYPSINDRFVDVHTEAKGMSWLRTLPGRSWFPILRLYGPLEVWFDQTWRPGEVQPA